MAKDLNYFKTQLLAILDKKEKEENKTISKALGYFDYFAQVSATMGSIEKGTGLPIGTKKEWPAGSGKWYVKTGKGWIRTYDNANSRGAKMSIAITRKKIQNAQSLEELLEIVQKNKDKFTDKDGKPIDIVKDLMREVHTKHQDFKGAKKEASKAAEKVMGTSSSEYDDDKAYEEYKKLVTKENPTKEENERIGTLVKEHFKHSDKTWKGGEGLKAEKAAKKEKDPEMNSNNAENEQDKHYWIQDRKGNRITNEEAKKRVISNLDKIDTINSKIEDMDKADQVAAKRKIKDIEYDNTHLMDYLNSNDRKEMESEFEKHKNRSDAMKGNKNAYKGGPKEEPKKAKTEKEEKKKDETTETLTSEQIEYNKKTLKEIKKYEKYFDPKREIIKYLGKNGFNKELIKQVSKKYNIDKSEVENLLRYYEAILPQTRYKWEHDYSGSQSITNEYREAQNMVSELPKMVELWNDYKISAEEKSRKYNFSRGSAYSITRDLVYPISVEKNGKTYKYNDQKTGDVNDRNTLIYSTKDGKDIEVKRSELIKNPDFIKILKQKENKFGKRTEEWKDNILDYKAFIESSHDSELTEEEYLENVLRKPLDFANREWTDAHKDGIQTIKDLNKELGLSIPEDGSFYPYGKEMKDLVKKVKAAIDEKIYGQKSEAEKHQNRSDAMKGNKNAWKGLTKAEQNKKKADYILDLVDKTDRYTSKDYENLKEQVLSGKKGLIGGGDDIPVNERAEIIDNLIDGMKKDEANETNQKKNNSRENKTIVDIKKNYQNSNSVEGWDDEININGEKIQGKWKLVEAETPMASHDENTFQKTPGFPTNNGGTINDRDYEHDNAAKESVTTIAADYDDRALGFDEPIVVTTDGIVVSGNNRTMSSKLAAKNGTDKKYLEALEKKSKRFGINADELKNFKHPRIVFEIDHKGDYTTDEFAKFNKSGKKTKSTVEKAVEVSKTIKPDTISSLAERISEFDTLGDLYSNKKASREFVDSMVINGVIQKNEVAQYYTEEGGLSENGKEFIETTLVGGIMNENNIRSLSGAGGKSLRQKLVRAIVPLIDNKGIGKEYTFNDELNKAVNIALEVSQSGKFTKVQDYIDQGNLFGETVDPLTGKLAQLLHENTQKEFAEKMRELEGGLRPAANGEFDLFLGECETRNSVVDRILQIQTTVKKALNRVFDLFR